MHRLCPLVPGVGRDHLGGTGVPQRGRRAVNRYHLAAERLRSFAAALDRNDNLRDRSIASAYRVAADSLEEQEEPMTPAPLDGLQKALRRQHLEETHRASGSCPGWTCPTARVLALLMEPKP